MQAVCDKGLRGNYKQAGFAGSGLDSPTDLYVPAWGGYSLRTHTFTFIYSWVHMTSRFCDKTSDWVCARKSEELCGDCVFLD